MLLSLSLPLLVLLLFVAVLRESVPLLHAHNANSNARLAQTHMAHAWTAHASNLVPIMPAPTPNVHIPDVVHAKLKLDCNTSKCAENKGGGTYVRTPRPIPGFLRRILVESGPLWMPCEKMHGETKTFLSKQISSVDAWLTRGSGADPQRKPKEK